MLIFIVFYRSYVIRISTFVFASHIRYAHFIKYINNQRFIRCDYGYFLGFAVLLTVVNIGYCEGM